MTGAKPRREDDLVRRPLKRAEYGIRFITRQAEKGWKDGLATYRNAIVDAWDRLSIEPAHEDGSRVYRLKADLARGTYQGQEFDRYQYKFPGGGRIWYFIDRGPDRLANVAGFVLIEEVHTAHPNETK